eukprot:7230394-Alexandrium_andersonii.AAC.1
MARPPAEAPSASAATNLHNITTSNNPTKPTQPHWAPPVHHGTTNTPARPHQHSTTARDSTLRRLPPMGHLEKQPLQAPLR